MSKETPNLSKHYANIKVVGCGGAGNNAINRMIDSNINTVEFIAINTDIQDLHECKAKTKIQIGTKLTKGLGAGARPEIGTKAAEENLDEIQSALKGADLVFITAGMGGGTGTGSAAVVADIARKLNCLTIAIVTTPFEFEGSSRMKNAEAGINRLSQSVDTIVVIKNEKLFSALPSTATLQESFSFADDILKHGIQGISDLITVPALINLDFADVKTIMESSGLAHLGIGVGKGERRIVQAAENAINSALLETKIDGAHSILVNITGNEQMTIFEIKEAITLITEAADKNCNIIFGAVIDNNKNDEVCITVIATNFQNSANVVKTETKIPSRDFIPTFDVDDFASSPNTTFNPSSPFSQSFTAQSPVNFYSTPSEVTFPLQPTQPMPMVGNPVVQQQMPLQHSLQMQNNIPQMGTSPLYDNTPFQNNDFSPSAGYPYNPMTETGQLDLYSAVPPQMSQPTFPQADAFPTQDSPIANEIVEPASEPAIEPPVPSAAIEKDSLGIPAYLRKK